jgi:hypothetical protein
MKMSINILCAGFLSILIGLSACKPSGSNPSPAGYSGSFVCLKVSGEAFHHYYIDSSFDAYADFTATPGSGVPAWVDSVTINGMPMEPDGDSVGYIATNYLNTLNFSVGASWWVKGAHGISSFTYNDQHTYPAYTALPDTMFKALGFTFPLNATAAPAADSIEIELDGGAAVNLVKTAGSGGITFSATELNSIQGDSTIVVLHAASHVDQIFGGQRFAFIKDRMYYKTVYLK